MPILNSKFPNTCKHCKKPISIGDRIEWIREKGTWHIACAETKISFQHTVAGLQGMILGTESRHVPLTALRATVTQADSLTPLESSPSPEKQANLELPRLTPAISAHMLADIRQEKEILALLELTVDQSLPRDIRRASGERLNDINQNGAVGKAILSLTDAGLIRKLSRVGTIDGKFMAFAKGKLAQLNERQVAA